MSRLVFDSSSDPYPVNTFLETASSYSLSVIVPARNEEDCVGDCLRSLAAQSEPGWELGREWEILLVDDGSTDRTRAIAQGIAGVTVMEAAAPPKGWTGKAHACWTGWLAARGEWLLFTDADTVHEPGHLRLAMIEAERHKAGMLSYSPRQVVTGLAQRTLMPLIFSELSMTYSPAKINDPETHVAAANGQFILVRREVYQHIGGHEAVADTVLEDVALANLVKRRKLGLRFRYAPEAVSARMYRSFGAMWEGWTKNLALLFGNPLPMAGMKLVQFAVIVGIPLLACFMWQTTGRWTVAGLLLLVWLRALWGYYRRVAKSHFPFVDCLISPLGVPLLAALLWRSWFQHTMTRRVSWKGREYAGGR
ncbi:glycosyltransferase [Paracidobacterium acidisoli]|uniref:Glycosyltransferase n=1 Tax=Paracidobacterium acidisoli TaxID=2303751 RepID=A0A372IRZ6_9BACT|nr:glycosyltransferase family 2 protein [Paracidobacterium acidisoli]MBT9330658.1 glycosyltransferase [Paracidobacterium acidisoli]